MTISMSRVGLDVHARETAAAVLDPASGEVTVRTLSGRPSTLVAWMETLPRPFQAVYEAGPTGYGLARAARARGLDVVVCAPGHIVRSTLDRIKTDKRDAIRLARLLLAGELRLVRVPEPAEEQLRDLVRAREDLRIDLMRCRARIAKFLLRRELFYPLPGNTWTKRHRNWLRSVRFHDSASELAFADALHAHDSMLARRDHLEAALEEITLSSWAAETVGRLRCLRGISTLSAAGLTAEVCDFGRFEHPRLLASYLGVVPSEDSSGEKRRQGAITKAGSKHARRLLVEAAWHYRRPPRVSHELAVRQRGQHPRVIEIAWRAQRRLYQRWQTLEQQRGKRNTIVAVAVARELAAFCWEVATLEV